MLVSWWPTVTLFTVVLLKALSALTLSVELNGGNINSELDVYFGLKGYSVE